ncbi:pyroglutamyl-peptidase I, partial [bacterium]
MKIETPMKKILLTAFEPFGGHALNASQEVALAIQSQSFEGATIELLNLPVERFKATDILERSIEEQQPDIIILLGEARSRGAITPERVAINVDDFRIPDNGGHQPREETVVEGAPPAYF